MTKNAYKYIEERKALARATALVDAIFKGDASGETQERMLRWFRNGRNEDIKLDAFEQALFRHLSPNEQPDEYDRWKFEELKERLGIGNLEPSQYSIKVRRKLTPAGVLMRIAAAIIPAMLVVGGYLWYENRQLTVEKPFAATHYVSVPDDEHRQLVLGDGTEIVLNEETSFAYGDGRECELHGEGYFRVAGSDEPFVIHTLDLDITVLGTEFNLCAYDDSDVSTVTLYSGSVKLEYGNGSHTLDPGMEFTYDRSTKLISVKRFAPGTTGAKPSWLTEDDLFLSSSLGRIFSSIESVYGITIENKHITDTTHVYSFRFGGGEPLDVLLSSLRDAGGGFDYTIQGNTIILETAKK